MFAVDVGGMRRRRCACARHQRANAHSCAASDGRLKLVDRKSATDARRLGHARQPRALAAKHATWTSSATGSSRRTSSIICRSVPPGSKLVMTNAIGSGARLHAAI